MHLVGFGLQPAEVAFDAIPGTRPFVAGVFAVIGIAVDDPVLPLYRKLIERQIGRRLADFAKLHQVLLALDAVAAAPRFDNTFGQGFRAVGQREVVVNRDRAAKPAAGRAGAERVVEAEQGWRWFAVLDVALGAVKAVAEMKR